MKTEKLGGYIPISFNEDIDMWFCAITLDMKIDNLIERLIMFRVSSVFLKGGIYVKLLVSLVIIYEEFILFNELTGNYLLDLMPRRHFLNYKSS